MTTASLDLVSVDPIPSQLPVARYNLAPAVYIAKLHPYRVHHIPAFGHNPSMTVYECWKIGAKPGSSMSILQDKSIKRQCGDITIRSDNKFNINYFGPDGERSQVSGLPMDQLPQAIQDLVDAGFG